MASSLSSSIAPYATLGRALLREGDGVLDAARLARRWRQLRREPRGQGEPVMVLPGFLTDDRTTIPLRGYLGRMGYTVRGWGLGVNGGDVEATVPRALEAIDAFSQESGAALRLVGWSLGGVIAREVARQRPALVDRIITLGTPVRGPRYTVFGSNDSAGERIEQRIVERDQRSPITVPIVALYSDRDAIVYPEGAIDRSSPRVENISVGCTHLGFGLSPQVYALVAQRLR